MPTSWKYQQCKGCSRSNEYVLMPSYRGLNFCFLYFSSGVYCVRFQVSFHSSWEKDCLWNCLWNCLGFFCVQFVRETPIRPDAITSRSRALFAKWSSIGGIISEKWQKRFTFRSRWVRTIFVSNFPRKKWKIPSNFPIKLEKFKWNV